MNINLINLLSSLFIFQRTKSPDRALCSQILILNSTIRTWWTPRRVYPTHSTSRIMLISERRALARYTGPGLKAL